jgi:hypothetical protein
LFRYPCGWITAASPAIFEITLKFIAFISAPRSV